MNKVKKTIALLVVGIFLLVQMDLVWALELFGKSYSSGSNYKLPIYNPSVISKPPIYNKGEGKKIINLYSSEIFPLEIGGGKNPGAGKQFKQPVKQEINKFRILSVEPKQTKTIDEYIQDLQSSEITTRVNATNELNKLNWDEVTVEDKLKVVPPVVAFLKDDTVPIGNKPLAVEVLSETAFDKGVWEGLAKEQKEEIKAILDPIDVDQTKYEGDNPNFDSTLERTQDEWKEVTLISEYAGTRALALSHISDPLFLKAYVFNIDIDKGMVFDRSISDAEFKAILLTGLTVGWFNQIADRGEKIYYVDRVLKIDTTNIYQGPDSPRPKKWFCLSYSVQLYLACRGLGGIEADIDALTEYGHYIPEGEGYGIPIYLVSVTGPRFGHGMNALFLGDNINDPEQVTDWDNWLFIEPQSDQHVYLGDRKLSDGIRVNICLPTKIVPGGYNANLPVVIFHIHINKAQEPQLKPEFVVTGAKTEEITLPGREGEGKVLSVELIVYESGTPEYLQAIIQRLERFGYIGEIVEKER